MRVTRLFLEDFRSYAWAERTLAPGVTALIGRNGAGKTNVLEAIHLIARGDSPRARDDAELVRWGANSARVSARVERVDDARTVDVVLFSPPEGERRRPRRYLLDGAGKRADEAIGELAVVSFFPEDVQLLAEAPSARRRYLDAMVGQAIAGIAPTCGITSACSSSATRCFESCATKDVPPRSLRSGTASSSGWRRRSRFDGLKRCVSS